jgi:hypothetical protein
MLKQLLLLAFLTFLGACQSDKRPNDSAGVAPPRVQVNPAARNDYMLTIRFADLPAPVNKLETSANFRVENRDCIPTDYKRALGGVKLLPEQSIPLTLHRVNDTTYTATFYEDAIVNEDYYRLGVCRWSLQSVSVRFQSPVTPFVSGISAEQIRAERTQVAHYLVRDFAQKPETHEVVFGEAAGFYLEKLGPQFTVTVSARRGAS